MRVVIPVCLVNPEHVVRRHLTYCIEATGVLQCVSGDQQVQKCDQKNSTAASITCHVLRRRRRSLASAEMWVTMIAGRFVRVVTGYIRMLTAVPMNISAQVSGLFGSVTVAARRCFCRWPCCESGTVFSDEASRDERQLADWSAHHHGMRSGRFRQDPGQGRLCEQPFDSAVGLFEASADQQCIDAGISSAEGVPGLHWFAAAAAGEDFCAEASTVFG